MTLKRETWNMEEDNFFKRGARRIQKVSQNVRMKEIMKCSRRYKGSGIS